MMSFWFTQMKKEDKMSIFYEAEKYSIIYNNIFFIHSLSDCYWGCLQTLAIVNNSVMNIGVRISLWENISFLLGIYPQVGLLDHMLILLLISWGTSMLFLIMPILDDAANSNIYTRLVASKSMVCGKSVRDQWARRKENAEDRPLTGTGTIRYGFLRKLQLGLSIKE